MLYLCYMSPYRLDYILFSCEILSFRLSFFTYNLHLKRLVVEPLFKIIIFGEPKPTFFSFDVMNSMFGYPISLTNFCITISVRILKLFTNF